jgi:two-component system, response regulator RegA
MQGDILMADAPAAFEDRADKSLLIVDDDRPFSTRLARAMEGRGYQVRVAESVADGIAAIENEPPAFAVIVVLTGYGNIATAVTAVKMGAFDYLAKPADADEIHAALMAQPGERALPPENPMSADRVRWEHIQRVYELCGRNVSETARRLNMHRRTLQRILAKRAPR